MSREFAMPQWAPFALCAQLLLVFFFPPLEWNTRKIFLSDLWCGALAFAGLLPHFRAVTEAALRRNRDTKLRFSVERIQFAKIYLAAALALFAIYLHGSARPEIMTREYQNLYFGLKETELFQAGREFVLFARFLTWLLAGALVYRWFSTFSSETERQKAVRTVWKGLFGCFAGSAGLVVLPKFFPELEALLASVYRFDPGFVFWKGRMYGAFLSPVESAVTLTLSGLVLCTAPWVGFATRAAIGAAVALVFWATHTMSPLASLVIATALLITGKPSKRWVYIGIAFTVFFVGLWKFGPNAQQNFLGAKIADLAFRTGPWMVYLQALSQRADFLFLGFGFATYHTDNSYMFLLTRGGILLVALVAWFGIRTLRRECPHWDSSHKLTVLFLLVNALALDVLIYRHVAMVLIAAGIPLLCSPRLTLKPN